MKTRDNTSKKIELGKIALMINIRVKTMKNINLRLGCFQKIEMVSHSNFLGQHFFLVPNFSD